MRPTTLFLLMALFAASSSVSQATVMFVTSSDGFVNVVDLTAQTIPYTDSNGNTATIIGGDGYPFSVGTIPGIFEVMFSQPVTRAGFTLQAPVEATLGAFQLSNGDSVATTCTPLAQENFTCFVGVIDTTPFSSFSISVQSDFYISAAEIEDFRYTDAATVPEPATLTLIAPLLIAGLAACKLAARAN